MKASELVSNGTVTIEDLKDFIDGTGNWESTQSDLNNATGFDKTVLDLNTDEDFTDEDILNSKLIDGSF